MTAAARLISRVDLLQQLLAAVAAVPAGVKLSIPALRDALVSQADVLDGLQTLVAAGELDRTTLRPVEHKEQPERASPNSNGQAKSAEEPVAQPPSPPARSGGDLADRVAEYCAAHGLALRRVIEHLHIPSFASLRRHQPRDKTVGRILAFLGGPPPPGLAPRKPGGRRKSDIGAVTGGELADRLEAMIAEHGLSKGRVGKLITGSPSAIGALRRTNPQRRTVEKIEALLANPPIEELRSKRKLPGETPVAAPPPATVAAPARRDPTQKPETLLMDVADRQRLNGQRHQANIRRAQEREATALLDQGVDPSNVKSTFQANTMRQVQDRRDREARDADPVEQAKLALQRKGVVVYSAIVSGGRKDRFHVGGQRDPDTGRLKELTPAELIDLAERKTEISFRRVA